MVGRDTVTVSRVVDQVCLGISLEVRTSVCDHFRSVSPAVVSGP